MGVPAHPAPDVGEDEMIRDLCLLASARQVVMANSTFCWWGTVIGDADETATDRVVVAPDRWLPERFGAGDIMLRPGWRTVAISNGASAPFR